MTEPNAPVKLTSVPQKSRYATVARLVTNINEFKQLLIEVGISINMIRLQARYHYKTEIEITMPKWLSDALEIS